MSENDSCQTNGDNWNNEFMAKHKYPKDSMDRLGDDLTELVLSYLSFDNSVRFECVSKQWRRLVYQRQNKLIIDGQFIRKKPEGRREPLFRTEALESVLKKCPNVTTINIQRGRHKLANLDQVLELVIKYCDRLYEFTAISGHLSDDLILRFFEKFGPKLKTITFFNPKENLTRFQTIIQLCPRLESIKSLNLRLLHLFDGKEVLVKSLKSFNYRFSLDDIERLEVFVERNKNSLESLSLDMSEHIADDNDHLLYDQLVRLNKLKRLRLTYEGLHKSAHHANFVNFVGKVAESCPKLIKLDIELYGEDYPIVRQTYKTLPKFEGLKYLRFICSDIQKTPIDKIEPLEDFEMKHQVHLELMCSFAPITDHFFARMSHNMPQLQTIHCENLDITDNAIKSLLSLSHLKEISLDWNKLKAKFSDEHVLAIISKFKKLNTFVAINTGVKTKLTEQDLYRFREMVSVEEWPNIIGDYIVSRHVDLK